MKQAPQITTEQEIPFVLIPETAGGAPSRIFGDPTITIESGEWEVVKDPDALNPLAFVARSPATLGASDVTITANANEDGSKKATAVLRFTNEEPLAAGFNVEFGAARPKRVVEP